MRFSIKVAIASLALFNVSVFGQATPLQIADNIRSLTQKSQALQSPAQSLTILDGPLLAIGQGRFPQIIAGFQDIISTATVAITQMQVSEPVPPGPDADNIFEAFREFVRVHQVLLNILIGKSGLFATVPLVGQPVAAVLRGVESVVDTIAFALIDLVQSRATDLANQNESLSGTLTTAIDSYDGLSLRKVKMIKRGHGVAISAAA